MAWESTSANVFRDQLMGDRQRAGLTADDLDEAAARLDQLAGTVEDRLAAIAVAAQAAADSANGTFGYNVTHVVTAGSPVALADIPDDVQVLSLENVNDLVPQLDGDANPSSSNHTTVRFESDTGTFDNHDVNDAYQAMADQLTGSDVSPSVTTFMDGASVFLADPNGGTTATTDVVDLHREEGRLSRRRHRRIRRQRSVGHRGFRGFSSVWSSSLVCSCGLVSGL